MYVEVEETTCEPVSVRRSYRAREDGRGRSSDVYQLLLEGVNWQRPTGPGCPDEDTTNRTGASAFGSVTDQRTAVSGESDDQPDRIDDQPDRTGTTNRTAVSGDGVGK